METWARVETLEGAGDMTLVAYGRHRNGYGLRVGSDRRLEFYLEPLEREYRSSSPIPDDGAWHHLAVSIEPTQEIRFYIDGESAGEASAQDIQLSLLQSSSLVSNQFLSLGFFQGERLELVNDPNGIGEEDRYSLSRGSK